LLALTSTWKTRWHSVAADPAIRPHSATVQGQLDRHVYGFWHPGVMIMTLSPDRHVRHFSYRQDFVAL
jgi:hypothetical protein